MLNWAFYPQLVILSVSSLLSVQVCGFSLLWEKADARIHYDQLLVDYKNSEMPGGGDGNLNINTGIFTCLSPGWYKVWLAKCLTDSSSLYITFQVTISAYTNLVVVDSKQEVAIWDIFTYPFYTFPVLPRLYL